MLVDAVAFAGRADDLRRATRSAARKRGNNNAYAQDNEISWFDWNLDERRTRCSNSRVWLVADARASIPICIAGNSFRIGKSVQGRRIARSTAVLSRTLSGCAPMAQQMTDDEWHSGWVRCIGMMLNGRTLDDVNAVGEPIEDDSFLLLLNPHGGPIDFYMPKLHDSSAWEVCLDTSKPSLAKRTKVAVSEPYGLPPRSAALLREINN